jgi:hypothetical protein
MLSKVAHSYTRGGYGKIPMKAKWWRKVLLPHPILAKLYHDIKAASCIVCTSSSVSFQGQMSFKSVMSDLKGTLTDHSPPFPPLNHSKFCLSLKIFSTSFTCLYLGQMLGRKNGAFPPNNKPSRPPTDLSPPAHPGVF